MGKEEGRKGERTSSEGKSVVLLPDGSPRGVVVQVTLSDTPVLLSDGSKTSSLPVLVDAVERKKKGTRRSG